MYHQCIFNSLSKSAQAIVALQKAEYTLGDGNDAIVSGSTCLLKAVIRKSHVDMNATTSHILTQLGHVDKIMSLISSPTIVEVNEKIKALVEELAARGETTTTYSTIFLKCTRSHQTSALSPTFGKRGMSTLT